MYDIVEGNIENYFVKQVSVGGENAFDIKDDQGRVAIRLKGQDSRPYVFGENGREISHNKEQLSLLPKFTVDLRRWFEDAIRSQLLAW